MVGDDPVGGPPAAARAACAALRESLLFRSGFPPRCPLHRPPHHPPSPPPRGGRLSGGPGIDLGVSAAGLLVGFVVGLTGMGGGALMTPILVIGFGVQPLA